MWFGYNFGCSRKRFSEKEAQRWWEEKQVLVYNKYDAEAWTNSWMYFYSFWCLLVIIFISNAEKFLYFRKKNEQKLQEINSSKYGINKNIFISKDDVILINEPDFNKNVKETILRRIYEIDSILPLDHAL